MSKKKTFLSGDIDKYRETLDYSIDAKESFKSDDEVGFFFESIKQIQSILNQFNIKNL